MSSSTMNDDRSTHNGDDDNMNVSTATPNDALIHESIDGYQEIEDTPWSFTDVGRVPERSRDGSPHATDEVFNSGSHLAASMLSLLGTTLLISGASSQGNAWKIVSFSIYGASLIFLFVCSTLHHAISSTPKVSFEPNLPLELILVQLTEFQLLMKIAFHDISNKTFLNGSPQTR